MAKFELKGGIAYIEEGVVELDSLDLNEGVDIDEIKSIVIPKSVTKICDYAFLDWENLTTLEIPENVKVIGCNAFAGCRGLVNIVLSKGIERIEGAAFANCDSLTSVVIPEGVNFVGISAFENSINLTNVVIEEGVKKLENSVFFGCKNLLPYFPFFILKFIINLEPLVDILYLVQNDYMHLL